MSYAQHPTLLQCAGDFKTIELIYSPEAAYVDALSGWAIDKWCVENTSGQGVALRRKFLKKAILDAVTRGGIGCQLIATKSTSVEGVLVYSSVYNPLVKCCRQYDASHEHCKWALCRNC